MKNVAVGVQVVLVTMADGVGDKPTTQFWVAAVPSDQAAEAVQKVLPKGWRAELTDRVLTTDHVARLNLRAGEVKEMTS